MASSAEKSAKPARVAVIMGSDSDLKDLVPCLGTLEEFGVPFIVAVASAHRAPEYLRKIVDKFEKGGGKVVIAAAGAAAHLPGVVASMTSLPVVGVPMGSKLLGLDSLLSIVQMPAGMPVATVGVGVAKNAALLAVQMLALGDSKLRSKYDEFRKKQTASVVNKSEKLMKLGYRAYLEKGT